MGLIVLFQVWPDSVWQENHPTANDYPEYATGMNDTHNAPFVTGDTGNPGLNELRSRVRDHWETLSKAERSVCTLLANRTPEWLLYAGAADLGSESGTSNATVVRTLQKLGYAGLSELKQFVASPFSSTVAPEVRLQQRIEYLGNDFERISDGVWSEAAERIELARKAAGTPELSAAVDIITRAQQVCSYGIGASGLAAEHLTLRLNRIGRPSRQISSDGFGLADDLLLVTPRDAIVVFAPGRMTTEIDVILNRARDVNASVILVSDDLRELLTGRVSVSLAAPHTPTGITAEALTSILIGDVLVQAVAAVDPELAVESSHSLTALRDDLGYRGLRL
jgi:DNA-binding MurR/RpiR family transcriptional regulator